MILIIITIIALLVIWHGFVYEGFDPDDTPKYKWANVPGLLKQVKVTDNEVWGINKHGQVYMRPIRGDNDWRYVRNQPLNIKQITASKDFIFAVDDQDFIKRCNQPCQDWQLWDDIFGQAKQVDIDSNFVYAVTDDNTILTCILPCVTTQWVPMEGNYELKFIASGDSYLWGITPDPENAVVYCKQPCNGNWQKVDSDFTKFKKLQMNNHEILGVDENDMIYRRPIDGSGKWTVLSGHLKDVSLNDRYIFSVNYRDNIFSQRIKD
jgi:hypothetical protein